MNKWLLLACLVANNLLLFATFKYSRSRFFWPAAAGFVVTAVAALVLAIMLLTS